MKILVTGGSSFTGYWFVRALAEAGHEVFATFTQSGIDRYDGLRARRIGELLAYCSPVWNCNFGDDRFIETIAAHNDWDLLCHHGAYVRDYKSLGFDVGAAVGANTHNLQGVLRQLTQSNCGNLLLTGSVFEQREGMGEQPLRAFSPYGLSKGLTAEVFEFWCGHFDTGLFKFVIPNPFGPLEEKRFTAYLINTWLNDGVAGVNTPDYVRDNIHVSLLARAYRQFAEEIARGTQRSKLNPCGYIESQGAFAERIAGEMRPRLGKACGLELARQEVFDEPRIRINFDKHYMAGIEWDETAAWDDMAEYYLNNQGK